jgi:hypothetical protein
MNTITTKRLALLTRKNINKKTHSIATTPVLTTLVHPLEKMTVISI